MILAACAAPQADKSASAESQTDAAAPGEEDVAAIPVVQEPATPDETGPAKVAVRTVHPDELMGKTGAEITELLGKPNLVRRETRAQVWQYRGQTCVLDLFFYPPEETKDAAPQAGADAVVYFETRGRDAKKVPGASCVNEVVAARAGAG